MNTGYAAPCTETDVAERDSIPLYRFSLEYLAMCSVVKFAQKKCSLFFFVVVVVVAAVILCFPLY
jgi:hypothetical protein